VQRIEQHAPAAETSIGQLILRAGLLIISSHKRRERSDVYSQFHRKR